MTKFIKELALVICVFSLSVGVFKIASFDFSTLEGNESPIIDDGDSFDEAQQILKEYGYNLKEVIDIGEIQDTMPDLKTYNYEGENGIISFSTDNTYLYSVNYYE
ncbi:hypothetical protein [Paraclostridium bifermentans]|uniref:hypothetical protein n=1 Tax=Paraclostridium bifermentans TaxID=1490 RepID=UPI00359C8FD4